MAGSFPLHKHVLNDSSSLESKWRDLLRQTTLAGPELAESVSTLESLSSILNREQDLLSKLVYTKNNQMRNFKFWHFTKQANTRLKALRIGSLSSTMQSLHLRFTYVSASLSSQTPLYKSVSDSQSTPRSATDNRRERNRILRTPSSGRLCCIC